jgi:hypothetical protein
LPRLRRLLDDDLGEALDLAVELQGGNANGNMPTPTPAEPGGLESLESALEAVSADPA